MNRQKKTFFAIGALTIVSSCFIAAGCGEVKLGGDFTVTDETTIIERPEKNISDYSDIDKIFVVAGKLKTLNSYRSNIAGETKAMFGFTQKIHDVHIKNGKESYMQALSTSPLVNVGKQAYFKGNKVVMRDAKDAKNEIWSSDFKTSSVKEYKQKIGCEPTDLSNYILNDKTVTKVISSDFSDGIYTIKYELDPQLSTPRYALKMMNFGNLDDLPVFSSCKMTLVFDETGNPLSIKNEDVYSFKRGVIKGKCTSELTETFFDVNKEVVIPNVELFKNEIDKEITDIEETELSGEQLLINTLINTDLKNGVRFGGNVIGSISGVDNVVPMDIKLAFDFDKLAFGGVSQAIKFQIQSQIGTIPVQADYIGDNFLYLILGETKYKYAVDLNSGNDLPDPEKILSMFNIKEKEKIGNTQFFDVVLSKQAIEKSEELIKEIVSFLDVDGKSNININSFVAKVGMDIKGLNKADISSLKLTLDMNEIQLIVEGVVSGEGFKGVSKDDLKKYTFADWNNFSKNVNAIVKISKGISNYSWNKGMNFGIGIGTSSDVTGDGFVLRIPVKLQNNEKGLRAYIDFLYKIYYEKGNIYLANTKNEAGKDYFTMINKINILDKIIGMLGDNIGNKLSNVEKTSELGLLDILSDAALFSTVEKTTLENGIDRINLTFSPKLHAVIQSGYSALWETIGKADLGDLSAIVGAITQMFNFTLDTSSIRADFEEGVLKELSIRLTNNGSAPGADGNEISFIIRATFGKIMDDGEMDNKFNNLYEGITALDESKAVREMIEEVKKNGVENIGDSYKAKLDSINNAYNALSKEAKMTVIDYIELSKLQAEWTGLRADADKFIDGTVEIIGLEKQVDKDKEIHNILVVIDKIYKNFDARQKEYVNDYIENEYRRIRLDNEINYSYKIVIDEINNLTVENYPTAKEFKDALNRSKDLYNNLLDETKKLIIDYDVKIKAAEDTLRKLELEELDRDIGEYILVMEKCDGTYNYNQLYSVRNSADKYMKTLKALKDDEKLLITNLSNMENAYIKLYDLIGNEFVEYLGYAGQVSDVQVGKECYDKIMLAEKYSRMLNNELKNKYADQLTLLTNLKAKHKELEVKMINEAIANIGKIEFTDECHDRIIKARKIFNNIQASYRFGIKVDSLIDAECEYVILSLKGLNKGSLTNADKDKVIYARSIYDEAITAYNFYKIKTAIKDGLKEFETELKEFEKIINSNLENKA